MSIIETAVEAAVPEIGVPVKAASWGLHHIGFVISTLGCIVLAILLLIQKGETRHWQKQDATHQAMFKAEKAAFEGTVANWRAATAAAKAADIAHKTAVETSHNQTTKDMNDAITQRRDAARAIVRRVHTGQTGTNPGSGTGTPVPSPTNTASSPNGAGESAELSEADKLICADNTVKAQGWPAWWKSITAVPN